MQSEFSQNVVRVQSECSQNAVKMQSECSQDVLRTRSECSKNVARMQSECSQTVVRNSQNIARMQLPVFFCSNWQSLVVIGSHWQSLVVIGRLIRLIKLDFQQRGRLHSYMWMDGWLSQVEGSLRKPSVLIIILCWISLFGLHLCLS